ncbi:hypothetical protein FA15DRAFT_674542 [Coprinopsis marcescibilis]|uniref:Uncharacterized protein n=1 Tax=Coprinopsis marcescibilis TaxID=230819 RepID=A0A5C3KHH1_COPMA|nr:hypothetical protein FA15DRAFT_674542 [Coprinopsis marcescibilis]
MLSRQYCSFDPTKCPRTSELTPGKMTIALLMILFNALSQTLLIAISLPIFIWILVVAAEPLFLRLLFVLNIAQQNLAGQMDVRMERLVPRGRRLRHD